VSVTDKTDDDIWTAIKMINPLHSDGRLNTPAATESAKYHNMTILRELSDNTRT